MTKENTNLDMFKKVIIVKKYLIEMKEKVLLPFVQLLVVMEIERWS